MRQSILPWHVKIERSSSDQIKIQMFTHCNKLHPHPHLHQKLFLEVTNRAGCSSKSK